MKTFNIKQHFYDKTDTSDIISTFSSEFDNALNASNAQTIEVIVTYTNGDTETINLFKEVQS